MNCDDFQARLVSAARAADVVAGDAGRHLLDCAACRTLFLDRRLVEGARAGSAGSGPCPTPERLAGFLDGSLDAEARSAMVVHLMACGSCRREMMALAGDLSVAAEASELVQPPAELQTRAIERPSRPSRRPRAAVVSWPRILVPLAAAAVGIVAIGLGLRDLADRGPAAVPPGERVLRGEALDAPHLVSPLGSAGGGPLRFTWRPAASAAGTLVPPEGRYRLVVAELESGSTVLEVEVAGTSRELTEDESARLEAGVRYHWMVVPLDGTPGQPSETASFTRQ